MLVDTASLMSSIEDQHREPLWVSILHWSLITLGVVAPWLLHFTVAWWAAWIAVAFFLVAYNRLFVPEGSLCMGIPFVLPLGASMLLLLVQGLQLLKWCIMRFTGG